MIRANLRRQIEIEEHRKAVRKVWGGEGGVVSVFLNISTAGNLGELNGAYERTFIQSPTGKQLQPQSG